MGRDESYDEKISRERYETSIEQLHQDWDRGDLGRQ